MMRDGSRSMRGLRITWSDGCESGGPARSRDQVKRVLHEEDRRGYRTYNAFQ